MKVKISEARFNDMVYLTLGYMFFKPVFGEEASPRECDIRVCMNCICPKMMVDGITAAILLPNEVSPKSHTKFYKVETDAVLAECRLYMEDHWFKAPMTPEWETGAKEYFVKIVDVIMKMPEDQCAKVG